MTRHFTLTAATALALTLAAFTTLGGAPDKTANGPVIGGLVGAAIGGAIGNNMAKQEAELGAQLAGSGAGVVYNGADLRVILPESITFATDLAVVNSSFRASLGRVADSLKRYTHSTMRVVGHTDNFGIDAHNQQLSEHRAQALASILIAEGTPSGRFTYTGKSFLEPMASNSSATGRVQNRRVEIFITPTS